jgi:hypothetical protein
LNAALRGVHVTRVTVRLMQSKSLTIKDVGAILNVPWRRAAIWFDTGRLHGVRSTTTQERLVSREQVVSFAKRDGRELGLTVKSL